MDFSPFYPHYTGRGICFVKHLPKTTSTPPQNPLHCHSHSRHNHSRSPAKHTLNVGASCSPRNQHSSIDAKFGSWDRCVPCYDKPQPSPVRKVKKQQWSLESYYWIEKNMHVSGHLQVHFFVVRGGLKGCPPDLLRKLDKGATLDLRSWICCHVRTGKMA